MDEFSGAALGDPRLTKRLIRLVDDLSAEPTKSIPLACGCLAETKTAYRLLDNEAVDWRAPLAAHGEPTVARMGQESRVLCVQRGSQDEAERNPGNRDAIIPLLAGARDQATFNSIFVTLRKSSFCLACHKS